MGTVKLLSAGEQVAVLAAGRGTECGREGVGLVAEAIVQQAEGIGVGKYDLIAMATHGRGGIGHFITGSVTERVLHTTKLPLLVVRPSKTQAAIQSMVLNVVRRRQ